MSDESEDESTEDDPDCPTIRIKKSTDARIKKSTDARIRNRWRRAITFCVLGKSLAFAFVHRRIQKMWARTGGVRIGDIGKGFFQASFDSQLDHDRALYGGPWTIDDHYIAAEPWRLDFDPDFDTITRASVWVRLPRLPLAYFDEEILQDIGDRIGRVEKIDYNTANGSRGNYARICVEIDLRKRLVSKYRIKRRVRRVEYEGLHTVCFGCGCYGHLEDSCPLAHSPEANPEERTKTTQEAGQEQKIRPEILEDFGPWMLATRVKRKPRQQSNQKNNNQEKKREEPGVQGSRFSVLDGEMEIDAEENIGTTINEEEGPQTNLETSNSASQPEGKSNEKIKEGVNGASNGKERKAKKDVQTREGNKEKMEKAGSSNPPLSGRPASTPKQVRSSGDRPAKGTPKSALSTKQANVVKQPPHQKLAKPKSGVVTNNSGSPGCGNERGQASGARAGHQPKMKVEDPCIGSKEKAKKKLGSPDGELGCPKKINFDQIQVEAPLLPECAFPSVIKANAKDQGREEVAMAIDNC
ncbi:unnamed protein product [Linum trigynum]